METLAHLRLAASLRATAPELSVVIPCHNEAETLESTLSEWRICLEAEVPSHEVLVINDGSTDGSGRILDKMRREWPALRVFHQLNTGHATTLRRGYTAARGTHVLQVDAGGRYEPSDFLRMWEHRSGAIMILGWRTHRLDRLSRRVLANYQRRLVNAVHHTELHDPGIPFRIMRREVVQGLLPTVPSNVQNLNLCLSVLIRRNFPEAVREIPVPYRPRPRGEKRLRFSRFLSGALRSTAEILALRNRGVTLSLSPTPAPAG